MLYIVATPIGNLGDISQRALDTLRMVDLIASEDTRKTGLLLKHFDIQKPQIAFYEHNERRAGPRIIEALENGQDVALVTSAGTPGISDPGFTLVRDAIEAGIEITMIPGAESGQPEYETSGETKAWRPANSITGNSRVTSSMSTHPTCRGFSGTRTSTIRKLRVPALTKTWSS